MAEMSSMRYDEHFAAVMKVMSTRGILLAAWKEPGVANAMTIGWGMVGSVWSRPLWQVLVRPSRYTCELLDRERLFTVNVLPAEMDAAVQLCGKVSGRDRDKLTEAKLTVSEGPATGAPVIEGSVIYYECHVLHSNDFVPEAMVPDIRDGCYPSGDYHRVYWGEVIDARVSKDGLARLLTE